MKDDLATAVTGLVPDEAITGLTPPDVLIGPRRMVAWIFLATCLVVMRLAVKVLPKDAPVRLFIEGSTSLMRVAVAPRRWLSAPAPSTLRGS